MLQTKIKKDFHIEKIEEIEEKNKIAKRKKISVKPMNEEEAILQMELLDHDFYMYIDEETNNDYGLITSE